MPWTTFLSKCHDNLGWTRRGKRQFQFWSELPMDICDSIFQHFDDADFLAMAAVCRAFNRNLSELRLPREALDTGTSLRPDESLTIPPDALPMLQRSICISPITRLSYRWTSPVHHLRDLQVLNTIVQRFPGLVQLDLEFAENLLDGNPEPDVAAPIAVPESRGPTVRALCSVIRSMARTRNEPVIILGLCNLFSSTAEDIAHCQLDTGLLHPADVRFGSMSRVLGRAVPKDRRWHVRDHGGERVRVTPIHWIHSVNIRCVPCLAGPFDRCTIVAIDSNSIRNIDLPTGFSGSSLSAGHLNAILPHLSLPCLTTARIYTSSINPAVLAGFLARHRTIQHLVVYPRDSNRQLLSVLPLLPNKSLALLSLKLPFDRRTQSAAHQLTKSLTKLPVLSQGLLLELVVITGDTVHPFDDEEGIVAASLQCITTVRIGRIEGMGILAGMGAKNSGVMEWLGHLPRLRRVEIGEMVAFEHGKSVVQTYIESAVSALSEDIAVEYVGRV
ncbi:hypothetical protein B0H15DRAFT_800974 [Mycena belliarum]|uniref:F-box domain-containing protein n=1 Tax=Mycena belliarum TaxID=1033014 RepID=A0AAD6U2X7_9AGAR|nr:hypothetical protein B0H15DRAFT_800974 [Mycena belliae]